MTELDRHCAALEDIARACADSDWHRANALMAVYVQSVRSACESGRFDRDGLRALLDAQHALAPQLELARAEAAAALADARRGHRAVGAYLDDPAT